MSILDYFVSERIAASNERLVTTNVNGVPSDVWSDVETFDCNYWEGASAEAVVLERLRDKTSAAIGIYPENDVEEGDIIHVNGEKYHALKPQNIIGGDDTIIVALEVFA